MSGMTLAFVLMPCIGACLMAAALRDWRLVAAAAFGALGIIALAPFLPLALRLFSLPVLMGVVIGATVLGPRLYFRPDQDIWSRMLWALVPTFGITFLFMLLNAGEV